MKKAYKKPTVIRSSYRDSSKKKPTKLIIDSSKKVTNFKEDEKQVQNNITESQKEEQKINEEKQKEDKIIHEYNLKVIEELQNNLEKVEKENDLIFQEILKLKEQKNDLLKTYDKLRDDIENEKDELEELKDINDSKNREYLQLMHLRHQNIMNNPNIESDDSNGNNNININNNNNDNEGPGGPLNRFTLGDIMDGLLSISRIRGENREGGMTGERIGNSPFMIFRSNENNEDGPPMSYSQLQALPSSNYPRYNNNNEKCVICGFDFCYNDVVTKLVKCNHIFHKPCLVNRLSARQSSKCPTCKVSII